MAKTPKNVSIYYCCAMHSTCKTKYNHIQTGKMSLSAKLYQRQFTGNAFEIRSIRKRYVGLEANIQPTASSCPEHITARISIQMSYKECFCKSGIVSYASSACSSCGQADKSFEHLFATFHYSVDFWGEVIKQISGLDIQIFYLCFKDMMFGITDL